MARVVSYCKQQGIRPPTDDMGGFCRARAKLAEGALRELSCDVAEETEQGAEEAWLCKGKHAKLIDGFTFTMLDTPENQAEYPQQRAQSPGVGFPIPRAVAIVSLATACVMDLEFGPYQGQETGGNALLRLMLARLKADDITVLDRCHCSFMMIALLLAQLYGFRWNSELDIRSIKSNLNLGHVRCVSPKMVRREVRTTILGYNLIRATAAGAALLHGNQSRQISFTSDCQYVLTS